MPIDTEYNREIARQYNDMNRKKVAYLDHNYLDVNPAPVGYDVNGYEPRRTVGSGVGVYKKGGCCGGNNPGLSKAVRMDLNYGAGIRGDRIARRGLDHHNELTKEYQDLLTGGFGWSDISGLIDKGKKAFEIGKQVYDTGKKAYDIGKEGYEIYKKIRGKGKFNKKELRLLASGYAMGKGHDDIEGAGFWSDFADGFKKGFKMVSDPVLKPVLGLIPHPAAQIAKHGLEAVGLGKSKRHIALVAHGYAMGKGYDKVEGAGFWSDFADGFKKGFKMVSDPILKPVLGMIPHPGAQIAKKGLEAVGLGEARGRRRKASGEARGFASGEARGMARGKEGKGFLSDLGIPIVSDLARNFGLGEARGEARGFASGEARGRASGEARGRKGKGTAFTMSANPEPDVYGGKKKNKRAMIVKKVMKDKGLSLIEASKYVKAHNLY